MTERPHWRGLKNGEESPAGRTVRDLPDGGCARRVDPDDDDEDDAGGADHQPDADCAITVLTARGHILGPGEKQ